MRQLAYHHRVADSIDGTPVAATYSTRRHIGLVQERWRGVDG